MADRTVPGMPIEMGNQLFGRQRQVGVGKKLQDTLISGFNVIHHRVNLDSIASRE
jgi:hypothetical protein